MAPKFEFKKFKGMSGGMGGGGGGMNGGMDGGEITPMNGGGGMDGGKENNLFENLRSIEELVDLEQEAIKNKELSKLDDSEGLKKKVISLLLNTGKFPFTANNKVEIFIDGNEKFERLILNGVTINDRTLLNRIEKFCKYAVYNNSNKLIGIGAESDSGFKLIKLFL